MSVRLRSKRLVSSSLSTDRSESEKKDFEKACQCCDKKKRFAIFKDLGVLEYRKALELQTQTVEAIQSKTKTLPCSLPDQNNNQENFFRKSAFSAYFRVPKNFSC